MSAGSHVVTRKPAKNVAVRATRPRAGVVGAGLMGRCHAKAITRAGASVTAFADVDGSSASSLASNYGAQSFTNVEEMLDRVDLDVLHICTPLSTHNAIADLAIDAGLHLIIEKPATSTAFDLRQLLDRAAERAVLLCPVHQFTFQDGVLKAVRYLPRIGELVHLEGVFCSAGGTDLSSDGLDQLVADILPHPLSLMQMFLPARLPESEWLTVRPRDGELRAVCETSGVSLSILISTSGRPTVCSFQVVGTRGTIHLDLFHGFAFVQPGTVSKTRKMIYPFDFALRRLSAATANLSRRALRGESAYPGLQRFVKAFYDAVQGKARPPISPEDAVTTAVVRDVLIRRTRLAAG